MKKNARCVEVRTSEGQIVFSLYLYDTEPNWKDNQGTSVSQKNEKKKNDTMDEKLQIEETFITDAQKRYLFRILAEQGIEGDKAHQPERSL
jgi:hypothetical protein